MDQPQPLFDFIFVLFKYKLYGKTVGVNRIRTRIVGVHGEYTDHLTTTAAYLWNVIVWFFLKRPFPVSFFLHVLSFPISEQLKYDQKNCGWLVSNPYPLMLEAINLPTVPQRHPRKLKVLLYKHQTLSFWCCPISVTRRWNKKLSNVSR